MNLHEEVEAHTKLLQITICERPQQLRELQVTREIDLPAGPLIIQVAAQNYRRGDCILPGRH